MPIIISANFKLLAAIFCHKSIVKESEIAHIDYIQFVIFLKPVTLTDIERYQK